MKVYNTDGSEGSKTINNALDFARSAYKVTPEQHDLFVKILSDKILNKELDNYFKSTELSVDYHPPIELSESLNEAGITEGEYDDGMGLFPFKTTMVISERGVSIKWGEGKIFHDKYDYNQNDIAHLCNYLVMTFSSSNEEL